MNVVQRVPAMGAPISNSTSMRSSHSLTKNAPRPQIHHLTKRSPCAENFYHTSPFKISFSPVFPLASRVLNSENSPLKSSRSNNRSTCLRTSPSPSNPLPRFCRINVWNPEIFAVLIFIRTDFDASPVVVNGCYEPPAFAASTPESISNGRNSSRSKSR